MGFPGRLLDNGLMWLIQSNKWFAVVFLMYFIDVMEFN